MLKWAGGCLVVVIVLLAGGSWFAMRSMRESLSPDGVERITIAASPARVFASLADGDSAATWMAQGNKVTSTRHGRLQPGDSIRIEMRASLGMQPQAMIWVVQRADSNNVRILDLHARSVSGIMATRRDSLVAQGDSTLVISTLASSLPDSTKSSSTAELMLSMFRMQSKLEMQSLKARIEGAPQPARR